MCTIYVLAKREMGGGERVTRLMGWMMGSRDVPAEGASCVEVEAILEDQCRFRSTRKA